MSERGGLLAMARNAAVPASCILLLGYFAFHAIGGNSGVLAWGGYKAERAELTAQLASVDARKEALETRVKLLDPRRVDPDLADELVRGNLGVVRGDEVIVPLPKAD
jgi:cell division protein FtsB